MKVAFWSEAGIYGDVTGYLAAISVFCTIFYEKNVVIGRNYLCSRKLEDYFFSSSAKSGMDDDTNHYSYGEPEYFRKLWEDRQTNRETVTMEGIRLLRPPDISDSSMFYRDIASETLYFMDLSGGINASVACALEEADLVAVFLPQDTAVIHTFFDNYSSIIPKAVFFVINYRTHNECTPTYLTRIYGIKKERIGTFPYSEVFEMACEEGAIESFIRGGTVCSEKYQDKYFKRCVKKAAKVIVEGNKSEYTELEGEYEVSKQ